MCGWEVLLGGALGLASVLATPKPSMPPPLPNPAATPDAPREGGATVRVGAGQEDQTTDTGQPTTPFSFVEQRGSGKALGGLGKSSMTLGM